MKDIAHNIASDHGFTIDDLLDKDYKWQPDLKAMKKDFCSQCIDEGYSAKQIAKFMGYNRDSIYRLIGTKDIKKWQRVLNTMKEQGHVTKEDFGNLCSSISIIRDKGHHVYRDGQKYKLA